MTLRSRRSSLRLPGYDYRTPAAYFVTICTHDRIPILQAAGNSDIVEHCWAAIPAHFPQVLLDAFVVMPNHIHGILHLLSYATPKPGASPTGRVLAGSLSSVVRSFKAASTREFRTSRNLSGPVWQRNYFDRIVADQRDLDRLREYIANNPANWHYDAENPSRDVSAEYLKAWSWVERPQGAAVLRPYPSAQPLKEGSR